MASLGADGPLGEAAAAVPQLATAGACLGAQSAVAAETTAVAEAVKTIGSNLGSAASQYETQDQAAAASIDTVEFPAVSPQLASSARMSSSSPLWSAALRHSP